MEDQKKNRLRKFNRQIFNRITKLFAGHFFYALVNHTGRNSGRNYSTPVVAAKKENRVFIPLPYGTDTDWLLNVQAAGSCKVMIKGRLYAAVNPQIIDSNTASPNFSRWLQNAFNRAGIDRFLQLEIA